MCNSRAIRYACAAAAAADDDDDEHWNVERRKTTNKNENESKWKEWERKSIDGGEAQRVDRRIWNFSELIKVKCAHVSHSYEWRTADEKKNLWLKSHKCTYTHGVSRHHCYHRRTYYVNMDSLKFSTVADHVMHTILFCSLHCLTVWFFSPNYSSNVYGNECAVKNGYIYMYFYHSLDSLYFSAFWA